jgi:hypothetical protein
MAKKAAADLQEVKAGQEFRKWKRELGRADKREKDWRARAEKVIKQYRGEEKKKASFNILWPNTELLKNSLYNTLPKPDVRRRWGDADPLGKSASLVMERAITYSVEQYGFNDVMKASVLDLCLPGRAVARVRYVPSLAQVGTPAGENEAAEEKSHEAHETEEELEYECVHAEHVDWKDFKHGFGRNWQEVQWVAFRHLLGKDDVKAKFGEELANEIKYDLDKDEDDAKRTKEEDAQAGSEFARVAEFWEIWDKEGKRVFFFQEGHANGLIYPIDNPTGEPPLDFKDFYPCARPMLIIEDSSSLAPLIHFEQYKQQADELNAISLRINKIIEACRVRGVYDSVLKEINQLKDAQDNELIPASNVAAILAQGGDLSKSIWYMPIEQVVQVLQQLYQAEASCKAKIYEITGLSDILRGATDPSETLGAQQIKANFGNLRLKGLQREVQRYARDLITLMGEIIGEHFTEKTLQTMTEVEIPTSEQKQQAQVMIQAMQQQPPIPQQGQPDPRMQQLQQAQKVLQTPGYPEVMQLFRNEMLRSYRIDIETDSMIQESIDADMVAMKETLQGVQLAVQSLGQLVLNKAMPIQGLKSVLLAICRKARMGLEVEDAIETMQEPQPPAQPQDNAPQIEQMKIQAQGQMEQARQQHEQQMKGAELQASAQLEQSRLQMEMQAKEREAQITAAADVERNRLEAERETMRQQNEAALKQMESEAKERTEAARLEFERWKAQLDADVKVAVAQLGAQTTLKTASMSANAAGEEQEYSEAGEPVAKPTLQALVDAINQNMTQLIQSQSALMDRQNQAHGEMVAVLSRPRKLIRDASGKAQGID